jgi:hypothetical protein
MVGSRFVGVGATFAFFSTLLVEFLEAFDRPHLLPFPDGQSMSRTCRAAVATVIVPVYQERTGQTAPHRLQYNSERLDSLSASYRFKHSMPLVYSWRETGVVCIT